MLPRGWHKKTISEILDKVSIPVDVIPSEKYREIGIRSHARGIFHKAQVTGKSLGNKRVFHIEPNCFVVNIVFAWEQAVAKTTANELGMIASHRFPMFKPKAGNCDIDYILYLFKTAYGKHLLGLASPGGAGRNKTLGQSEFAKLTVNLPPIEEQSKIAKIITIWDKAIAVTEKLISNSQQQKQALMQQLLSGEKHFPEFNKEWNDVHLAEVADVIVSPVDKKSEQSEMAVELCNYKDVYYNNYITQSINFMKATASESEIKKYALLVGDVIITKDSETPGDIAISALVTEGLDGVLCGYHLAIVRPKATLIDGAFLNFLFSLPKVRYYFFTLANGATRFGLSVGAINKAHFRIPTLEEQKRIAKVLTGANHEIEILQQKLKHLKQEKKALMQQLLTGKRRVTV